MKKSFLSLVAVSLVLFFSTSVVFATSFSDLTNVQKQKYWSIMSNDCLPLLAAKNYKDYRTCALNALETAAKYQESAAWCTDDDGGANFTQKGIVQTDIKPNGVADYIYTFPNGSTYLMEGMCSNTNKYYYIQKNCSELGNKYHPDVAAGACVYVNNVPVFEDGWDGSEQKTTEGWDTSIWIGASDADGDNLTFSAENLPEGATFNKGNPPAGPLPEGVQYGGFYWQPTYEQAGEYEVTFKVSDGVDTDKIVIKIVVVDANQAPKLMLVANVFEINEGDDYTIYLYGTDEDGDNLTFSGENLPEGSIIDGNAPVPPPVPAGTEHAVFSWTPTNQQAGTYEVTFKVSDGEMEDSIAVEIIVANECKAWDKTFGGGWAYSIQQTADEGYIVAGRSNGDGIGSLILKLNSNGDSEWKKTFGVSNWEDARSVQQTADGGYIVAGLDNIAGSFVLKLDSNGELKWEKNFGGQAYSVQQTTDGGYIVAGLGFMNGSVLKLDSNGELEWGGNGGYDARSVQQTADGGYIVAGKDGVGSLILKLGSNGNLEWGKTIGGSSVDHAYSIQQTTDGGYIVAGRTYPKEGVLTDAWIFKLDSNGNLEWDEIFGGSDEDQMYSVQQTTDGGYIAAGRTRSKGAGNFDSWVLKLGSNGNLEWDKTFGGSNWDGAYSVQQTTDEGYVVAGETTPNEGYNVWVLKLDENGNLECE